MSNGTELKRIIWAVDPFAKDAALQRSAARAIKNFTRDQPCIIEPVYLYSAMITTDFPLEIPTDWIQDTKKEGQKRLDEILDQVKLHGIKPLHLISAPYLSIREGIEHLSRLAKRWRADLVVCGTHARRGIKRWVLGSFAETLLLYFDLPLLLVNPHWSQRSQFKEILFPTDFSDESREAFTSVLHVARSLKLSIRIFHKLIYDPPTFFALPVGTAPLYTEAYQWELDRRFENISDWAEQAKEAGVQASTMIDRNAEDSVAHTIITEAKQRHSVIAMASRSGAARAALLGSTTRQVVRTAPFPVWVLHPQKKAPQKGKEATPVQPVQGVAKKSA